MSKYIVVNGNPIRISNKIKKTDTRKLLDLKNSINSDDFVSKYNESYLEIISSIHNDIKDEYSTIDNYKQHIRLIKQYQSELDVQMYDDIIKVISDIIKEEQVHIGELNKCLQILDSVETRSFNEGVNEARELIEK